MIRNIKKLFSVLTYENKIKLFYVLIFQIFNSLFDILAIVSIYPFLAFLSDAELIKNNFIFIYIFENLNLSEKNIILVLGLLSILAILINQSFKIFSTWYSEKINLQIWLSLHNMMYKYYLERPYSFHLENNSTSLLERLQVRVNAAAVGVIIPPIYLISHLITTLAVLSIMLITNVFATISTFLLFFLFYFFIYKKLRNKLTYYGEVHPVYSNAAFNIISNSFKSITEIKLRKNENFFVNLFSPIADKYCEAGLKKKLYSEAPVGLIEIIAYVILIIISLIFLGFSDNIFTNLPLVGIFVFSLRKILPALQMIYKLTSDIIFNKPSFEIVYDDLKNAFDRRTINKNDSKIKIKNIDSIFLKKINFSFNKGIKVLNNVDINIKSGQKIGIIGESGSGKTTLLNILMCLLKPTSGSILFNQNNQNELNEESIQRKIGYVSQSGYIIDNSILENVAFGQEKHEVDNKKVIEVLKIAQLYDFIAKELNGNLLYSVGENGIKLSGGQRQRLRIARTLYYDPDILIFDEATNALDSITETKLINSINKNYKNKTIISIAHRVNTLRNYDIIYIMDNGRIIESGKYDLLSQNSNIFNRLLNQN